MSENVLKVEHVSKKFSKSLKRSLWYGVQDLAVEFIGRRQGQELRPTEFWALNDVSFDVRKGEMLGLIGANGAGKSTLLKLINGLIKLSQGTITVHGQIGALIELGTGFSPILTGRENIYVNAAVLGIPRREVDKKLEAIISFAEIGDFIDTPVQNYSSGMKVRLGYSVAANLEPDLLLIDEVLSVGDSSFRARCFDHLNKYRENGGTVIFVSHNTLAVEAASDRVMWLEQGQVKAIGDPADIVQQYEQRMLELSQQADLRLQKTQKHEMSGAINIKSVQCYDLTGNPSTDFEFGESIEIRMHYETNIENISFPYFNLAIRKGKSREPLLSVMAMNWNNIHLKTIPKSGIVGCVIKRPNLSPGIYSIYVSVLRNISGQLGAKWYTPIKEFGSFTILPGLFKDNFPDIPATHYVSNLPPMILDNTWSLDGKQLYGSENPRAEIEGNK